MALKLAASVNKSGKKFNVYSKMNGQGSVLGQIIDNEVYVEIGAEGSGISVAFVDPNGKFTQGYLDGTQDLPDALFTRITKYPLRNLDGQYVFGLRRDAALKKPNGDSVPSLKKGTEVVCNSPTVGESNNDYKHITGTVKNGAIDTTYKGYFVEMGFNHGSTGETMTLYGKY